jgi:hypothetical protein
MNSIVRGYFRGYRITCSGKLPVSNVYIRHIKSPEPFRAAISAVRQPRALGIASDGALSTVTFKRLPARYGVVLMPLVLSIFMTAIVSFIATVKMVGLADNLLTLWLSAWSVSLLIAFPTLLVVLPIVRRIVALFVEPSSPQR